MTNGDPMDGERIRRIEVEKNVREAAPLLAELRVIGIDVTWVADLRRSPITREEYARVAPILVRWLPRVQRAAVKEDIVRALSVRWIRGDGDIMRALLDEFGRTSDVSLEWAVGNALEVLFDGEDVQVRDELIAICKAAAHGRAREMFVLALGRSRDHAVCKELIAMLGDSDINGHVVVALGRLKCAEAAGPLQPYLDDSRTWVRRAAKKAIDAIANRARANDASRTHRARSRRRPNR